MVTLNCDMGESYGNWRFGDDAGIMPHVDCANIACGFHASDPVTMVRTVRLAREWGKRIGAHPSLPDREGFGRREMKLRSDELTAAFLYQIGALAGIAASEGMALSHVKPHGIVYGMAARDHDTALAIARAVQPFGLTLFGMAGTHHETAARELGVSFEAEFFPDLAYGAGGELLIPREQSAIDLAVVEERMVRALTQRQLRTVEGASLPLRFETVCMHSDPPNARDVAALLRRVIDAHPRAS